MVDWVDGVDGVDGVDARLLVLAAAMLNNERRSKRLLCRLREAISDM